MLGYLSRGQLTELETQLNSPRVRFVGRYLDPFRPVVARIANNNSTGSSSNAATSAATTTTQPSSSSSFSSGGVVATREVFQEHWGWSAKEVATYVLWWAFRPAACASCGNTDTWKPCLDSEYLCPHCCVGAGNTRTHDVFVKDTAQPNEWGQFEGGSESDESDGDGGDGGGLDGEGRAGGGGAGANAAASGAAALQRGNMSSDNVYAASSAAVGQLQAPVALTQWVLAFLRRGQLQEWQPLDASLFPAILRVCLNLVMLLHLPDIPTDGIETLKAACLFVACNVVIPMAVPFPVFQAVTVANFHGGSGGNNSNASMVMVSGMQNQHQQAATASLTSVECDLQWVDVLYVASMVGVELDDFFAGDSRVHTRNLVAMMRVVGGEGGVGSAQQQVSGRIYDPARSKVAAAVLAEMTRKHKTTTATAAAASSGDSDGGSTNAAANNKPPRPSLEHFSPDHTAAIFVLECGRQQPELVREWRLSLLPSDSAAAASSNNQDASDAAATTTKGAAASSTAAAAAAPSGALLQDENQWFLLCALAAALRMTPAAFTELVERSGLYGERIGFASILQQRLSVGEYIVPLCRRITPACASPWGSVFRALHSPEDRLPLLAVLRTLAGATTDAASLAQRHSAAVQLLQHILRKHGALLVAQFNYILNVTDPSFANFQGLYLCTQLDRRGALYLSLNQPRSIRFMGASRQVYLNEMSERNDARLVASTIACTTVEPIVVGIETAAARLLLSAVVGTSRGDTGAAAAAATTATSTAGRSANNAVALAAWQDAAAKLSVCAQLRRRANAALPVVDDSRVAAAAAAAAAASGAASGSNNNYFSATPAPYLLRGTAAAAAMTNVSPAAGATQWSENNGQQHYGTNQNKNRCGALLNTRAMLAHERRNPSWTTDLVVRYNVGDPAALTRELAAQGIFLDNGNNSSVVSPLEQRLRSLVLGGMSDLSVLACYAMAAAVQEQQQQQQNRVASPIVAASSNAGAAMGGRKSSLSQSPKLGAGQRRERSPPAPAAAADKMGLKQASSPKLQAVSTAAAGTGSAVAVATLGARVAAISATAVDGGGLNVSSGLYGALALPVIAREELMQAVLG